MVAHAGSQSETVSFVMRLWLEGGRQESGQWRWHVHHVQSGEERYFRKLADVLAFVAEKAGVAGPGEGGGRG